MRVALVSPLPPEPTGIADYTLDVAEALRVAHDVDLYDARATLDGLLAAHAGRPYDGVVYQVGNGPAHDFQYDWMARAPGIVVLHDLVLHHARSRVHLQSAEALAYTANPSSAAKRDVAAARIRRYDAEADAAYPGLGARLREAHLNTTGDLLLFAYPFFHEALRRATAAGAHNGFMADALADARPGLTVRRVAMPMRALPVSAERVAARRAALGFSGDDFVVGSFGLATREKRLESVARAVARIAPFLPAVRLLIVGPVADSAWLDGAIASAGIANRTVVTGRVPLDALPEYMGAADAVAHLRWPTGRETSAALLRVLAQGRPCLIADLAHQTEIPENAAVRIDVTDEEGGLARGLLDLARDRARALRLGENAAAWVRGEHSPRAARESYEALIEAARAG